MNELGSVVVSVNRYRLMNELGSVVVSVNRYRLMNDASREQNVLVQSSVVACEQLREPPESGRLLESPVVAELNGLLASKCLIYRRNALGDWFYMLIGYI